MLLKYDTLAGFKSAPGTALHVSQTFEMFGDDFEFDSSFDIADRCLAWIWTVLVPHPQLPIHHEPGVSPMLGCFGSPVN